MKLRLKFFFICVFLFSMLRVPAQQSIKANYALDSLIQSLVISEDDTNKVNNLNKIGKSYIGVADYDRALQFANKSRQLAEKLNYSKGVSLAYNIIGSICLSQGNFSQALDNFNESLKIRKKTNDKAGEAASYNNIGLVYYNMGDFEKSIDNYLKSS